MKLLIAIMKYRASQNTEKLDVIECDMMMVKSWLGENSQNVNAADAHIFPKKECHGLIDGFISCTDTKFHDFGVGAEAFFKSMYS